MSSLANEWLRLHLNAAPLHQVIAPIHDKQQQYGLLSQPETVWSILIPASEIQAAGTINISIEAVVNGETSSDHLTITVKNSAIKLWQKKHYKAALCTELRDDWLDQIETQSVSSLAKATQYLNLLTALQTCHPDQQKPLQARELSFNALYDRQRLATTATKRRKRILRYALISLALVVASNAVLFIALSSFSPSDPNAEQIKQLGIQLQDNSRRLGSIRALQQFVTLEDSALAKAVLSEFEKQSFQLLDSAKKSDQQQGLSRTNDLAKQGSKTAMKSLGKCYQQGQQIDPDWGKAWHWYNKAGAAATPLKAMLEEGADTFLHDKNATVANKNLAYQVAEKAAESEPAGDPAQKWMEYRYRVGEGVAVDIEKALYWRKRFDGEQE